MAKSKLIEINKKIKETVVGEYRVVENGVVGTYRKVEDKFVDSFLTRESETLEEAKARLATEQKECEKIQTRMIQESLERSRNADKR